MSDLALRFRASPSITIEFPDRLSVELSSEHLAQLLSYLVITGLLSVQLGQQGSIYQDLEIDLVQDDDGGFVLRVRA
jgi:hypothetical protein